LLFPAFFRYTLWNMEAAVVNQILVKLLLLALNLMPVDQAGFNFHVMRDGVYAATYRVERRDQDFTIFRPSTQDEAFPAFDAERSRRFGRSYTVRVHGTGEILSVVLTDIMRDMPPLDSVPRQILKTPEPQPATEAGPEAPPEKAGTAAKTAPRVGTGEKAAPEAKTGAENQNAGLGDIRIDGVGRTLFLTIDGQALTIAAEMNHPAIER
jgi:hypothetical protein